VALGHKSIDTSTKQKRSGVKFDQAAEMIAGKWLQICSEIGHSFYL
jgi:hypothetical protein